MTNHALKRQLKTLRAIAPNRNWLQSRRDVLLAQLRAQGDPAAAPALAPASWSTWLRPNLWAAESTLSGAAAALYARGLVVAVLVLVFGLGSFGYVVTAAEGSIPGDNLYGLKVAVENVRLRLATSPRSRVALQVEFAARRLDELAALSARDGTSRPATETLVAAFEMNVTDVAAVAARTADESPERGVELAQIVDGKIAEYEHALKATGAAGGGELTRRVDRALATVSRAGTQALKVIVENNSAPSEAITGRLSQKIQSAEDTLKAADEKLAQGGAKGPSPDGAAKARGQSAVAKTNLAEAKKKLTEGDYKAALAILDSVEDIVNEVAESAEAAQDAAEGQNSDGAASPSAPPSAEPTPSAPSSDDPAGDAPAPGQATSGPDPKQR